MPSDASPSDAPLLTAHGIVKSFGGVRALDGAQLAVHPSRCVALLGENGAGKSTLMNILAGGLTPDAGELRVNGQLVSFPSPRAAQRAGVAIVHQELALAQNLTVAENIFLGREPLTRWGLIDFAAMNRAAQRLLEELHGTIDPSTPVSRLRVGAQQMVEIAKALSVEARVLILDEPTSALTESEVDVLLAVMDRLKRRGVGIVYITHRLDELPHVADDVTVMRDGRHIATRPYAGATRDELIELIVGRRLPPVDASPRQARVAPALSLNRVSLPHEDRSGEFAVSDASLVVRQGEILGVFGLLGAGRTELLETVFGLHAGRASGAVGVGGAETAISSPADAVRAGLALVPEDRKGAGLVMPMSVLHNASLACLDRVKTLGVVSAAKEKALVTQFVERLRIKTASLAAPVGTLSGGNQQKVVLAKCLATRPKVLLLDEPTRGIDVGARQDLYDLIAELARGGMAILLASSELPELLALADRIVVMAEGRVTAEFTRAEATEQKLLHAAVPASRIAGGRVA